MSERWPGGIISQTAPVPSGPYQNSTAPGVWTLEQQAYWARLGQWPTAGNVDPSAFIENLFQTWLYTGTGSTQTITNGIDLSTKGGLVWQKGRSSVSGNTFIDTVRGGGNYLQSQTTDAQVNTTALIFNNNGFTTQGTWQNTNAATYVGWTFREQPKFFDIVTYTGNGSGSGRTISHNLGSVPGMMILKVTNLAGDDWYVYHRSIPTRLLALNSTNSTDPTPPQFVFGNGTTAVAPTSTEFTIGSTVNGNTYNYIVYLFAHDAGGFGLSGNENVISCGTTTMDGSGNATISLGYEPQYVLGKRTDAASQWFIFDTMRGWAYNNTAYLQPNNSNAEGNYGTTFVGSPTATGFTMSQFGANASYIYMAIRRGPMAVPTLGTSVFNTNLETTTANPQTLTTGFPVDLTINTLKSSAQPRYAADRLRGGTTTSSILLSPDSIAAEITYSGFGFGFDNNTGIVDGNFWNNTSAVLWNFRRAPGFFDIVCYTGDGTASRVISHNLTVSPELIISKARTGSNDWRVASSAIGFGTLDALALNSDAAKSVTGRPVESVSSTTLTLALGGANTSSTPFVTYLFATVAGVSKVGSYTGTGGTQTINCGFTTGARWVLIKRTDSTGNWWMWDTARGMVAGTDPRIPLNSQTAEANNNWVYTESTGFQIVTTDASVNASGGTYIFLAIA